MFALLVSNSNAVVATNNFFNTIFYQKNIRILRLFVYSILNLKNDW